MSKNCRLLFLFRKDLIFSSRELAQLVLEGLVSVFQEKDSGGFADIWSAYADNQCTKISLGVRNEGKFSRICEDFTQQGHKVHTIQSMDQDVLAVVGPVEEAVPKSCKRLQLYNPAELKEAENSPVMDLNLVFFVRQDLMMPAGKLVAQLGHACEGLFAGADFETLLSAAIHVVSVRDREALFELHGILSRGTHEPECLEVIEDAGRTVFGEPTVTLMGALLNRKRFSQVAADLEPYGFTLSKSDQG